MKLLSNEQKIKMMHTIFNKFTWSHFLIVVLYPIYQYFWEKNIDISCNKCTKFVKFSYYNKNKICNYSNPKKK